MSQLARKLKSSGVLGINERNARFTLMYNPRSLYPLADSKIKTKQLAIEHAIPVPQLYAEVAAQGELKHLEKLLSPHPDFVLKPCHGSGGEGVLIISGREGDYYRRLEGSPISLADLKHHLANILAGLYSLGAAPDSALIEKRVRPDSVFRQISHLGTPDIRVIVFLGVPVMAMVRLPTSLSNGRANLHQGAVGAGISIGSGVTNGAVWKSEIIIRHPDTDAVIRGLSIPHWDRLLFMASSCYDMNKLGYQGVDLVIDQDEGPLLLETNVRPGLSIQLANQAGLLPRLRAVEKNQAALSNVQARIKFARETFY